MSGSATSICGAYASRKPPKFINELWAGAGIGFASCGYCDLIIFNNHRDHGWDGSNCASEFRLAQVARHDYSKDFALSEGSAEGGGPLDTYQGSIHTEIALSEGNGTWDAYFVGKITVTKSGGYVTDVNVSCCHLNGTISCNNTYWIKGITGTCEDCTDGPASEPGTG